MASPYDLILDLGFRTEDAPPSTFPIRVVMSWEQAKSLSELLQFSVQDYENEVGEIREFGEEVLPARDFEELEALEDVEQPEQLGMGEEEDTDQ
jgi:hypothetical protein